MGILGTVIFIFIAVHMSNFWYKFKFTEFPARDLTTVDGVLMKDYYKVVVASFKVEWIVIFYVLAMVMLAFHLSHGFSSAFQTVGLNHNKYNKLISRAGHAFAIIVPLLFAIIPVYIYLK
jgi:succinate dehydrogenase / fumarate reductase cytochrome b subunit